MPRKKKPEVDTTVTVFRRQRGEKLAKAYSVKFVLNGKQILKSTGCHEREEAERWARGLGLTFPHNFGWTSAVGAIASLAG